MLLGIACLSFVFALASYIWLRSLPPLWWLDHDKTRYNLINKAIAADPRQQWETRLYDFIKEADLESVPWDDANLQNQTGSLRIYHLRGFRLYVDLYVPHGYSRNGGPERILLEQGSPAEKRQSRDLIRISHRPFMLIDGINSREERMRQFWIEAEESARQINDELDLKRKGKLNREN